jgi:hypothetical protein
MTIQEYIDERKKADMKFWTRLSDLADAILLFRYRMGFPIKRDLKSLIDIENKISEIEL